MTLWIGIVATAMLLAFIVYALTGGADFGGGVWDLFARGERADEQRELISRAIGPVWEANHVWLIIIVVLLFTAFPDAFYAIVVALHLPLFLMLLGVVLRGASYVFRAYGMLSAPSERLSTRVFAISSLITPVLLGVSLGAVLSGDIVTAADGTQFLPENYIGSWAQPFPLAMGIVVLLLFSYLAAVYLAVEAESAELSDDFRFRALGTAVVLGPASAVTLLLARDGATAVWSGLIGSWWSLPFHLLTGVIALLTIVLLVVRKYRGAQFAAGGHVTLMIVGWAGAQYPNIIPPSLSFADAATHASVLRALSIALIVGFVFLIPAFVYLYRVFKPSVFGR